MLAKYYTTIFIKVTGMTKSWIRKPRPISFYYIPTLGAIIDIKARSQEDAEQRAAEIGKALETEFYELNGEKAKTGIILTGFDEDYDFQWFPQMKIETYTAEVRNVRHAYNYKDEPLAKCANELTPAEFVAEFGYICPLK